VSTDVADVIKQAVALTGGRPVLVGRPAGGSWLPLAALADADGLHDALVEVYRAYDDCRTPTERTAAAALFVADIAALVAAPVAGALLGAGLGLVFDSARVWLRLDPRTLAVDGAVPVAGDRAAVAGGYAELLGPLLTTAAAITRRGARAYWVDAADRLVTALFLAGRALGDPAAGRAEAEALLAVGPPAMRHAIRWLEFEYRSDRVLWKRRAVCCLAYQTPLLARQYCATCPLIPVDETVGRMRTWLASLSN